MIFFLHHLYNLLPAETLHHLNGYIIGIVLVISILMTGCRRMETMVRLFAFQSFGLVLITLFAGIQNNSSDTLFVSGIAFVGKCFLIPWILMKVLQKVQIKREIETYISLPTSMLLICCLTALVFEITTNIGIGKEVNVLSTELLSTSISMILIGLFIMMTRKKAFAQILGLYVMENGILALTVDTIFEMPMVVEMGIFLDLLIGVLVMGIWVFRIKQSFDTINVEELQKLKG